MRRHGIIAAIAVALPALTGCAQIRGERSNVEITVPELSYVDDAVAAGPAAIAVEAGEANAAPFRFLATELGTGRTIVGTELYAARPMLLLFSVPSCPACRAEAAEIADAAVRHPNVNFVIAHSQGSIEEIQAFNDEHGLTGLDNVVHLDDADMALWTRFSVVAQPYYVLVDVWGGLASSVGALDRDGLDRAAARLTGIPT